MKDVSVIIPSREEEHLNRTVDEILSSSRGRVEVIVFAENWKPDIDKRAKIIYSEKLVGMRHEINTLVEAASGKYIMKSDSHCTFDKDFDLKLMNDHRSDWISVPTRYVLSLPTWKLKKRPINYMYITHPDNKAGKYSLFRSVPCKDFQGTEKREILIDDIMTFQGSCWFMNKDFFKKIGGLDEVNCGHFGSEALELSTKSWLSGGRVVVNKKTWYGHMEKYNNRRGVSRKVCIKSSKYMFYALMNNKIPNQTRDFKWLVNKFWPLEGWPDDWNTKEKIDSFNNVDMM